MELKVTGALNAGTVLFWPDEAGDAALFESLLHMAETKYRVLVPICASENSLNDEIAALERVLLNEFGGQLWGAYGLRSGGSAVLLLLSRGNVRVHTAIVEGAVSVPPTGLEIYGETLVCWKGSKDKQAAKFWEALRAVCPAVRSLTMKKLKAGKTFFSVRPDLMFQKLEKTIGTVGTVCTEEKVRRCPEDVWEHLCDNARKKEQKGCKTAQIKGKFTQTVEGSGKGVKLWSCTTHAEPFGENGTICREWVGISAGKLTPLAVPLAKIYLQGTQKLRNRQISKE